MSYRAEIVCLGGSVNLAICPCVEESCLVPHQLVLFVVADECRQPKILSSLYFNMELCHVDQDTCHLTMPHLPKNMYLTSDPDGTMTYEHAVQEVCTCVCVCSSVLLMVEFPFWVHFVILVTITTPVHCLVSTDRMNHSTIHTQYI